MCRTTGGWKRAFARFVCLVADFVAFVSFRGLVVLCLCFLICHFIGFRTSHQRTAVENLPAGTFTEMLNSVRCASTSENLI